ncbi:MAG: hypothetical protein HYV47_00225 [Candidatus Nealsonbacteria bacterium]|nr:hypothetical protein [Candidatus Nealsonbacteria bacterium]
MSKNITVIIIFAAVLTIGLGFFNLWQNQNNGDPSINEAGKLAIDFINQALEGDSVAASLLGITEESGVYKIHLKIKDTEYDSFLTKDGKYLFSSAFNLH